MATMISEDTRDRPAPTYPAGKADVFTIHATKNDQSIVTHRIIPDVAVAQARVLNAAGWRVRISGTSGRQFAPSEFGQLLTFDRA